MGVNRGKDFEDCIREACEAVPDTSVTRLIDPQAGYAGVRNICDFIVYKYPTQFFLECKSCHGNTLSIHSNNPKKMYGEITNTQWEGLLEKSEVRGVVAGVLIWFIDHDKTVFVPIQRLKQYRQDGYKSVNITKMWDDDWCALDGRKKRIYFEYDMEKFFANFC